MGTHNQDLLELQVVEVEDVVDEARVNKRATHLAVLARIVMKEARSARRFGAGGTRPGDGARRVAGRAPKRCAGGATPEQRTGHSSSAELADR